MLDIPVEPSMHYKILYIRTIRFQMIDDKIYL